MKILFVDDDEIRSEKALRFISEKFHAIAAIDLVSTGVEARARLSKIKYDLLVLDVLLPVRAGQSPSHETSLSILTELAETDTLQKPNHIIGLTAYKEAEQAVAPKFIANAWALVRSDELNDDWLATLGNAVSYVIAYQAPSERPQTGVDLVVITALRSEMEAVHRLPWNWSPEEPFDNCTFFAKGNFTSNGRTCSVITAVASRMGMVTSSILASKLIARFKPRIVAMPGISAGLRSKTQIGDVICADMTWDYQSGKHAINAAMLPDFLVDPHFIQLDEEIGARWGQLARDIDLASRVWMEWPDRPAAPPRLLRGPVACGSAVLANSDVTNAIQLQQRKVLGVEMELYGMYLAVEHADRPKPLAMGIKSVCDFADPQKSDGYQNYAAYVSASMLRAFFERYMSDF